jgi:hypothetical protein
MRNGLTGIGFSAAAATEILVAQGYDSLTTLAELTDKTIKDLVATLRKPGGTIPNPAIPAIFATIPNPGINVIPTIIFGHNLSELINFSGILNTTWQHRSQDAQWPHRHWLLCSCGN